MKVFTMIVSLSPALVAMACTQPASQASAPPPTATASATPTAPAPAAKASVESLVIDFPLGSAALSADADSKLDQAGRLYREASPVQMTVAGHTDRTGDDFSNLLLSARRADVVKKGLVDRGIPADKLQLQAFGASEPAVVPDPNSAANRAAVITWR
jgi:outer membrane protein OmpA-like peptidoglycan-associated protein